MGILHRRSSTAEAIPSSSVILAGELAVNTNEGRVFTKTDANAVIEVGVPIGTILVGHPSGMISPYWLPCNGASYARTSYPRLGNMLKGTPTFSAVATPSATKVDITTASVSGQTYVWMPIGGNTGIIRANQGLTGGTNIPLGANLTWTAANGNSNILCVVARGPTQVYSYTRNNTVFTTGAMPSSRQWTDIVWNGNIFCAIAANDNAIPITASSATSSDGLTWTASTGVPNQGWNSLAWGSGVNIPSGRFVAVPNGGNSVIYSQDGLSWSLGSGLPNNQNWISVTWGKNKFCAIAQGTNISANSTDGITWTLRYLPVSQTWTCVGTIPATNPSTFASEPFLLAVANGTSNVCWSTDDGDTWRQTTITSSANWNTVGADGVVGATTIGATISYNANNFNTPLVTGTLGTFLGFGGISSGIYYIKT